MSSATLVSSLGQRAVIFFALGLALIQLPFCQDARAVSYQDPNFLSHAPDVVQVVGPKEFIIHIDRSVGSYERGINEDTVLLVVHQEKDPLRPGYFKAVTVGRAAVTESGDDTARLILYKVFKNAQVKVGDRLLVSGDPITDADLQEIQQEKLGLLARDAELEDLYKGLISIKYGLMAAKFSTTSTANGLPLDTNSAKNATHYILNSFGLRWWPTFNPVVGLNIDYATGSIVTTGRLHEQETSKQTYLNPGLLYRGRLFGLPAIYSVTYFINSFSTTNPDDYLISSTYSGVNLGATFYWPFRINLLRVGSFNAAITDLEIGGGYSPSVNVSDGDYQLGTQSSATEFSLNGGLELNFTVRKWDFTKNLFFVLEFGMQTYNLSFSGPVTQPASAGETIPQNAQFSESQSWYGFRIKYNLPDYIGGLFEDD